MTATKLTKAQLIIQIAALEARLAIGHSVCKAQRERIAELEARVATPGVKAQPASQAKPVTVAKPVVTTYYDRSGNLWEKTRVGNRASSRCIFDAAYIADCNERDERACQADMASA